MSNVTEITTPSERLKRDLFQAYERALENGLTLEEITGSFHVVITSIQIANMIDIEVDEYE